MSSIRYGYSGKWAAIGGKGGKGFSLLELLVVLVIIGLLAGIVGPRRFKNVGQSEITTARAQVEVQPSLPATASMAPTGRRWASRTS